MMPNFTENVTSMKSSIRLSPSNISALFAFVLIYVVVVVVLAVAVVVVPVVVVAVL